MNNSRISVNEMNKNILSKSLARYLVVQATFSQSFGLEKEEIEKSFIINNDLKFHTDFQGKFLDDKFDEIFFLKIFNNVIEKEKVISKLISENLRTGWSLSRLPRVLEALLRAAISEMISYPETSTGIIISEYLKLAESFNISKESSFINAILDKVHKELLLNG